MQGVVQANSDIVRKTTEVEDMDEEEYVHRKFTDKEGHDDDVHKLDGSSADSCTFSVFPGGILEQSVGCVPLDCTDDDRR